MLDTGQRVLGPGDMCGTVTDTPTEYELGTLRHPEMWRFVLWDGAPASLLQHVDWLRVPEPRAPWYDVVAEWVQYNAWRARRWLRRDQWRGY